MSSSPYGFVTVEEQVLVDDLVFVVTRPTSAEDLIDEEEYAVDERLPYWADLWPSGRILAEHLASRELTGMRIVELGAGLALPSLVAAARGAHVVATDWYEPALAFVRQNAAQAGVVVETMLVDWRDPEGARRRAVRPADRVRRAVRGPQRRPACRPGATPARDGRVGVDRRSTAQ